MNINNFQRIGSVSNSQVGRDFEEAARKYFKANSIDLTFGHSLPVRIEDKKIAYVWLRWGILQFKKNTLSKRIFINFEVRTDVLQQDHVLTEDKYFSFSFKYRMNSVLEWRGHQAKAR